MKGFVTIVFAGLCSYALIVLWPAPAEEFQPLQRQPSPVSVAATH